MKKIILLIILLLPISIKAMDININLESKSAIVVNLENNEILYEKNINEKLPIASLTKIMTTILSLENINNLDDTIIVTKEDISNLSGYVTIGLKEDLVISYRDLLFSTILYSAADSAQTLSNHIFSNHKEFIKNMNNLAKKIGMKNTLFSNPIGKDDNNYSTSYDLYLLLDYALKNKTFYTIYTTNRYQMKYLNKQVDFNVNNIIKENNIDNKNITFLGTKTGFTTLSGLSLSGLTKLHNNKIKDVTVVTLYGLK